jgi:hypothetical protein
LEEVVSKFQVVSPQIVLKQNNFLEVDWSFAGVLYACATCFTEAVMKQLAVRFLLLKKGARVILLDKELKSDYFSSVNSEGIREVLELANVFQIVTHIECATSWGKGIAFIYRRL